MENKDSEAWGNFIEKSTDLKYVPKDPYSHATHLISIDDKDVTSFQQLLSKHVLLGNIASDELMRFYQTDIYFLTHFFQMSRRDEGVANFFKIQYSAWVFEVALTRARGGMERWLQSLLQSIPQKIPGYGKSLEDNYRRQQQQQTQIPGAILG